MIWPHASVVIMMFLKYFSLGGGVAFCFCFCFLRERERAHMHVPGGGAEGEK